MNKSKIVLLIVFLNSFFISSFGQENEFINKLKTRIDKQISDRKKEFKQEILIYEQELRYIYSNNTRMSKTIDEYKLNLKNLKKTIDLIKNNNKIEPKDEFETTTAFNARKNKIESKIRELKQPIKDSISNVETKILELTINSSISNENELKKILNEYKVVLDELDAIEKFTNDFPINTIENIKITSFNYNADTEEFTLSTPLFKNDYLMKIDISRAKEFKKNIKKVRFIIGYNTILGFVYKEKLYRSIYPISDLSFVSDHNFDITPIFNGLFNTSFKVIETKAYFKYPYEGELSNKLSNKVINSFNSRNTLINSKSFQIRLTITKFGRIEIRKIEGLSNEEKEYATKILKSIFKKYKFIPYKQRFRYVNFPVSMTIKT